MSIWFLLIIPVIWSIFSKFYFGKKITIQEVGMHMFIPMIIITIVYFIAMFSNIYDVKYVHGYVTAKEREEVSCEHSYSCNCHTICSGSGSSRSCSVICQTCYEHSYDVDWNVKSNVGNTKINRVNRQGTKEPPRWTSVKIGEPFTTTSSFKNYIKAAKNSLFYNHTDKEWKKYPNVYDYYRYDQIIFDDPKIKNQNEWNNYISEVLSRSPKKVNPLIIITSKLGDMNGYTENIKNYWQGAKINDVVVIIQEQNNVVTWARVFTYGKDKNNELLVVKLRDELINLPIDKKIIIDVVYKNVSELYNEVDSKDFEYLQAENKLSTTWFIILVILTLVLNIGFTYWTVTNMIEEDYV